MATPDVRVRLSAEGVQEVVNALKRVQDEATKAGRGAAGGFGLFNNALLDLKSLLPKLGLAAAVAGMGALLKNALSTADGMGKLAQKTGATTETLSVLSLAATTADVSQEQLEKGLLKLSRSLDELQGGSKQATEAFRRIGLSAKDLEGLDTGEAFKLIAERLGAIEDSAGKAAVAQEIFGKGGAELIPLLNDLADGGYEKVRQKAEEMGLVISSDLARSAQEANDMLRDMANRVRGVAIQFASGLAPAVTQVMKVFGEAVSTDGVGGIKKLGEVAGHVAKGIVAVFVVVGKFFGVLMADIVDGLTGLKDAASALLSGDFSGAWNRIKDSAGRSKETWKSFGAEIMDIMAELGSEVPKAMETAAKRTAVILPQITEEQRKEALAAAKARAEFQKAALENEVKLFEAHNKLMAERDKAAYEQGLLSLREYYARRRETALSEIDKEIPALEAKKKIAGEAPVDTEADKVKRAQDVAAIQTQIDLKKIERLRTEETLAHEERQAARQLASERLQLEQKFLEAQGQRHDAALLSLDEELRKTEELLRKQGVAEAERVEILARQRTTGEAGIEFERLKEQADRQFKDIEAARRDIEAQVQQGLLFEFQGEDKIIALEKERLPLLRELAAEMQSVAEATGDPANIEQVRELNGAIRELEVSTDVAGQRMAEFRETLFSASTGALAQFFMDVSSGTKSVKDAFRDMALSVIQALQQMLAQMMAFAAMKAMFGAFGMPIPATGFSGGGAVKAAGGGFIKGQGTGTSDSIPAWLSNGEFVVRATVVKRPGVLEHLKELNRGMVQPSIRQTGGIRKFAEGGLVSAGGGKSSLDSSLTVGLEQGLVLKELSSPEGQRVLVRLLGQNKRATRQAIGG